MQAGVKIILEDTQSKRIGEFRAQENKTIVQAAAENNIEIPTSCCAGACFVCCAQIRKGAELVDIDKLGMPLVDLDVDETTGLYKQMLTCIGGIKSHYFHDNNYHEVVLQKLI